MPRPKAEHLSRRRSGPSVAAFEKQTHHSAVTSPPLPAVLAARSRDAFERLLTHDVRWGGESDTEQTCRNRQQAADTYAALLARAVQAAADRPGNSREPPAA